MNTNIICPINTQRINEQVARINAIQTVVLISAFIFFPNVVLALILFYDFFVRAVQAGKYSVLNLVSRYIIILLGLRPKLINAGPKLFAARIGFVFSTGILLSVLAGAPLVAIGFAGIFGICAFLEASIGFCLACKIYPFVYRFVRN